MPTGARSLPPSRSAPRWAPASTSPRRCTTGSTRPGSPPCSVPSPPPDACSACPRISCATPSPSGSTAAVAASRATSTARSPCACSKASSPRPEWSARSSPQRGFTGPVNFIEGRYGFTHLYARGLCSPAAFVDGLGDEWRLTQFMFKRFPSCGVTQGVTQQALDVAAELDLRPDDVARVTVRMPPYSHRLVGNPFSPGANPRVSAQFSVQYCVANAIARARCDARALPSRDGHGSGAAPADRPDRGDRRPGAGPARTQCGRLRAAHDRRPRCQP